MNEKLDTVLNVTTEVVGSWHPQGRAAELIQEFTDQYPGCGVGSAWAVELPYFIEKLVDSGEEARARQCLQDCYSQGISDEWWHEMYRCYHNIE